MRKTDFVELFTKPLIVAFRRNKNLHDILRKKTTVKILTKMVFRSPATPIWTTYAVYKYNQRTSSKVKPHKELSKYTTNSVTKVNT